MNAVTDAYAAVRGAGRARLLLGAGGVVLGLVGVWQFSAHVPFSGWVRVLIWFAAGILVHDGLLAPAGVVSGWLVSRNAPERIRPLVRVVGLGAVTLLLLALPLVATGGIRR